MNYTYSEEDVRAAAFYAGIALEAREKGITPKESFLIKFGPAHSAVKGYGDIVQLYHRGHALSEAGALLLLSPKYTGETKEEEIAAYSEFLSRQASSPLVRMEIGRQFRKVVSNLETRVLDVEVYYLAALTEP